MLCNRGERGSHLGGDSIQLRAYQKALRELGVFADYTGDYPIFDLTYHNEAWIFHCNFDWAYEHFRRCQPFKKTIRLFSIFYKGVYVNMTPAKIKEMVDGSTKVYCLSQQEKKEMFEELHLDESYNKKFVVIPNGVDSEVFNRTGIIAETPKNYVMSAGRFAGDKGFHLIVDACKKLKVPVLIVGAKWDDSYRDDLRKQWQDAWVIDQLPQSALANYYRGANTYVCAAENERNNLALIEAGACGAKLISSPGNRGNEWLKDIPVVDPKDIDTLAEKISQVYSTKEKVYYKIYDWKEIIQMILK